MFYVFHGDDEFSRSEEVARYKQQVLSAGMGDLNITELDGRRLTFDELVSACQAMPFLAERRLVVVRDMLPRLVGGRAARARAKENGEAGGDEALAQRLVEYLPQLPPSTRLVFVEGALLDKGHPILKQAQQRDDGFVKEFRVPEAGRLPDWVRRRAAEHGITIDRDASEMLATSVGPNLRQLDLELEKLAGHAGYSRPIRVEDVRDLVSAAQQPDVFGLVDSLGARQREEALRRLEVLLDDAKTHELYILTMIARQVRLLLATKDLADEGKMGAEGVQRELHLSRLFIAEKLLKQARMFRMVELEALLRRVAETDQAIKTGQIEGPLALEMLVIESCRRGADGHQPRRLDRTR